MGIAGYRRHALFYFGYYGALGAFSPYIGRWVAANGHGGWAVGAMLALWYAGRMVAPPAWARLTGHSAVPGHWLVGGCALALLGFAAFLRLDTGVGLFVAMAWFALFFNAVVPQFEALTLSALGPRSHDYGRVRVWGSVGFLLVAGSYGALLDRFGDDAFVPLVLPWLALTLAAAWPHRRTPAVAPSAELRPAVWRRPGARRLLGVALLVQLGFGPFYVFYTLHLQAHGHDGLSVGLLWSVGVLCEIAMFWYAPALIRRYGAARVIAISLAASVARWALVATQADSLALMALAQATHALGFAAFHAGCMRRMAELFPDRRDMNSAQGLLYGISSGFGGVLGAGVSALAWQLGGGFAAFLVGAAVTLAALVLHLAAARFGRAVPIAESR
ncbi:MAG TPA: MFS transporter [Lysobacter sp.]|nr:MFS transporter [Lysobacter sp.]